MEEIKSETVIQRWKKGIEMISPLQSAQANQKGNWVMFVGLIAGIIVMGFKIKTYWWIELILCGGLFNQIVTMIGIQQKIRMLKKMEEIE